MMYLTWICRWNFRFRSRVKTLTAAQITKIQSVAQIIPPGAKQTHVFIVRGVHGWSKPV